MLSAHELYSGHIARLPLSECLRLTALLLDDLRTLPSATVAADAEPTPRPRPRHGSAKNQISYMAADFDAPLDEMREYSE